LGFVRRYGNRERNGAPRGNPRDEREHNSEDDQHDDGARCVEAIVPKEDGEGADIENEAADKDAVKSKTLGVVCWLRHF